jgi:hypothetical protein
LFAGAFSDGCRASGHTHAVCHAAYDQVALEQLLQTRVEAHAFLSTDLHHADLVVDRVVELCALTASVIDCVMSLTSVFWLGRRVKGPSRFSEPLSSKANSNSPLR